VLANEQVIDGKCDRCKSEVMQKELEQWFFKITDFVEDTVSENGEKVAGLLSGLEKVDWPSSTKAAQRNWIGRSEGTTVKFQISNSKFQNKSENSKSENEEEYIEVFTTRVDTIFGCTYVVVAPEHPLIGNLIKCHSREVGNPGSTSSLDPRVKPEDDNFLKITNYGEVGKYLKMTAKKTDLERTELNKDKTGVKLEGVEAINPFTGESVPVFVADYVLGNYGTGGVMAVPAHDDRDYEFAKKYDLAIKAVIAPVNKKTGQYYAPTGSDPSEDSQKILEEILSGKKCFDWDGKLFNSGEYSDLFSSEAREKMTAWLEEKGLGTKKVNYRLRDWLISRQRYWGAPIPIIYCEDCGMVPVPEQDLPVKLPTDVDFRPTGESPLLRSESFQKVNCPKCGKKARREADTMDTFVCSSWYYLRFADPKNTRRFADAEKLQTWLPVDFYMGGAEHTVLHLLYARFFTKALAKHDYLTFDEPFVKLRHQGMVLAEDGRKMSKSLGNVVNPDVVVGELGADTLRLYEMFMGPLEDMKSWNTGSVVGLRRFLEKVWKIQDRVTGNSESVTGKEIISLLHKTIKKVTEDIEELKYNTAISSLMILVNAMEKEPQLPVASYQLLLQLLAPFAPHIAEEIWENMGNTESIFLEQWPQYDEKKMVEEMKTIVVQVNGKVRANLLLPSGSTEEVVKEAAMADTNVQTHIVGKEIRKVIYIQDKILNLVV
jgi:leucyl-tRNA synthetase